MNINVNLKKYIENEILPSYEKNDEGHSLKHIKYVINRSFIFAKSIDDIDYNMIYTIAAYHDIGHYIDAKNHEKVSAQILLKDEKLKDYFSDSQIKIMAEAVEDHRASSKIEPRSIYGKIVSSADRNTSIEAALKRTFVYTKKHNPNFSLEEILEKSRAHILEKFGNKGYATQKMYFEDDEYTTFLNNITVLANNETEFKKRIKETNNILVI